MNFKDIREEKILAAEIGSHAECLAAMDCLMHHMNDEDEIDCWLQDGVPDSDNWRLFDIVSSGPCDRRDYYEGIAKDMTYGEYEACVKIFANAVKRQCFDTEYAPRAFT